jgi:hypothetical protein
MKTQAFSRKNGGAALRSNTGLTIETIQHRCPSVFAENKHASRSGRYTYIPTSQILEGLIREGFTPVEVLQGGSRIEEKRGFTKHRIRMRHVSDLEQTSRDVRYREVILINSHDGTTSYHMMAGVFRMVCANGHIIAEDGATEIRVSHTGDILSNVIDGCIEVVKDFPRVEDTVRRMEGVQLTRDQQLALAEQALAIRYGSAPPIKPQAALAVWRPHDQEPTLWNTMNVLQENLINGGIGYIRQTEHRRSFLRTKAVNGIDQNTKVNRGIWAAAQSLLN